MGSERNKGGRGEVKGMRKRERRCGGGADERRETGREGKQGE